MVKIYNVLCSFFNLGLGKSPEHFEMSLNKPYFNQAANQSRRELYSAGIKKRNKDVVVHYRYIVLGKQKNSG